MIPISLTLKNFMSYGEEPTTLPFEGLHVACLSGDNGNGKSALLDAMTWALWGETRASSVGGVVEDDLIRVGTSDMEVRFEFALNDERYRVVKKRKKGKSSASDWQFAQHDSSGNYVTIGGGSQRETKKQITQLLSMEYETFINSAYLQQGRADEFTRQKPNDRKRILGEILGLDRYDRLEAKAKVKSAERKEAADELKRDLDFLAAEVARLPEHQANLAAVCETLATLETRVKEQETLVTTWREKKNKLDVVANQAANAEAEVIRLEADMAQREAERCSKVAKLKTMRETLDQRAAILSDYTNWQTARNRADEIYAQVEEFARKTAELQTVTGAIDIARTELQGKIRLLETRLAEVKKRRSELTRLSKEIAEIEKSLRSEAEVTENLGKAQAANQQALDAFAELRTRHDRLKEDILDLDEVLQMLAQPRAACPVCESDLSGEKSALVLKKQQAKRTRLVAEQETLKRDGAAAKQETTRTQQALQQWEAQAKDLTAQRARYGQMTARRDTLNADGADTEGISAELETFRKELATEQYAPVQRTRRVKIEKDLTLLGLAKVEHETLTKQIRNLEGAEKRYHALKQVEEGWEQEIAEQQRLEHALAEKAAEREKVAAKREAFRAQLKQYDEIRRNADIAEEDFSRLADERNLQRSREHSYRDYIARCEKAQGEHKEKSAANAKIVAERNIYNALAIAFGKKGVQALIIENVIPELQDEANELLGRMTNNAMHVTFETTRATRDGKGEIETLDIRVSDDAGTRPYELFSGGEGFRVNFAIRIALSRLLARRSGAKLQTLIMDEGFGSQDGKGREKLIEVIESIKDDFEIILVITHFEEMKDSFSQRIEIVKEADGSRIHLL